MYIWTESHTEESRNVGNVKSVDHGGGGGGAGDTQRKTAILRIVRQI